MIIKKSGDNNILYVHIKNNDKSINIFVIILLIVCGAFEIYKSSYFNGLFFLVLLLVSIINRVFFIKNNVLLCLNKENGLILFQACSYIGIKTVDKQMFFSSVKMIKTLLDYYSNDEKLCTYKIEFLLENGKKFDLGISLNREEANELKNLLQNFIKNKTV